MAIARDDNSHAVFTVKYLECLFMIFYASVLCLERCSLKITVKILRCYNES